MHRLFHTEQQKEVTVKGGGGKGYVTFTRTCVCHEASSCGHTEQVFRWYTCSESELSVILHSVCALVASIVNSLYKNTVSGSIIVIFTSPLIMLYISPEQNRTDYKNTLSWRLCLCGGFKNMKLFTFTSLFPSTDLTIRMKGSSRQRETSTFI